MAETLKNRISKVACKGPGHAADRLRLRISMARIRIHTTVAIVLVLASSGCNLQPPDPPIKRDIYLLLVDTLRADHLSLYGYERSTSPNLDRFAESATIFENVVSTASWTLPAVGSVMTGLYPSVHGITKKTNAVQMNSLRPAVVTLAESLSNAGYRTAAIVTNPYLIGINFGFTRGFEEYLPASMKNAPHVNELAREVIARDDPRPLFLYLHYMDPHGPYDRHSEANEFDLGPLPAKLDRPLTKRELRGIPEHLRLAGKEDLGSYVRAYDRAIRSWDESFGELMAWLAARTSNSEPLLAVIADHGEEFTDHGSWDHGKTLYQEQLAIPWILRLPGRSSARVGDRVVSLIDVAPTLLTAVGVPIPDTMTGIDVLSHEFDLDRSIYSETDTVIGGDADSHSIIRVVRRGSRKYIQKPSRIECYDLADDRFERSRDCVDVAWRDRAAADMKRWTLRNHDLAIDLGSANAVELDRAQQDLLREIGYLE
jgi:arylsulfatase A-like enzyme